MVHHVFGRVVRPDARSGLNGRTSAVGENEARREANGEVTPSPPTPAPPTPGPEQNGEKMTLESFDKPNPNDSIPTAPASLPIEAESKEEGENGSPGVPTQTIAIPVPNGDALDVPAPVQPQGGDADEEEGNLDAMGRTIPTEDLFVKDAFLVFRALCKLAMKSLVTEKWVITTIAQTWLTT